MDKNTAHIIWFKDLKIEDVPFVGGKNAALGEMISTLVPLGVNVPDGFAITAEAYRYFVSSTGLDKKIAEVLSDLDTSSIKNLQKKGKQIRTLILKSKLPNDLEKEISEAYTRLEGMYKKDVDVAVRSSATAEDLPGASFAGQQETFLNVRGTKDVIEFTKRCIASLFTDRAISYRTDKGFAHTEVALSVGIQKMVRSDLSSSGIMFSIDTETGFDKVVIINGVYGLGEMIVQGQVIPDEFVVFKPSLEVGKSGILVRNLGVKDRKMIYGTKETKVIPVPKSEQDKYCLTDEEVTTLGKWAVTIEKHFSKKHNHYQPMDMEWAKDGETNELYIVQARPETIHSGKETSYEEYRLKGTGEKLVTGIAVGTKIGSGTVRVIKNVAGINSFKKGEVLVTEVTDPDWEPIMKIASAIVTDKGGRTSHAAIVSRELGIPCIVGSMNSTTVLKNGMDVTVDCSSGKDGVIYKGIVPFDKIEHKLKAMPETKTKIMVNIGAPDEAFRYHRLPVKGVGLGRLEFIISSHIQIHPNSLIDYAKLKEQAKKDKHVAGIVATIDKLTKGYDDKTQYYVDELAEGVSKIGAAFWPNPVIIRFSDFKSNEYKTLTGGDLYEPEEANPMIGFRGASRYYNPKFKEAFGLECKAIKVVREKIGLSNVMVMVPFCRTVEEGKKVLEVMKENGLDRETDKELKVYVMCEIPSNVILADDFLEVFDGMSIGSNDLTQLTLGLDRDSNIVAGISNEKDKAVMSLIADVIKKAKAKGKYIGICGQAPSDFPDFAQFLVEQGIESMSLNPDTVIKTLEMIAEKEKGR
jgi:pyruvate,water dikinase